MAPGACVLHFWLAQNSFPNHVEFKDIDDNSIAGEDTVAVDPVTSNDGEQRRAKNAEASVPKKVKQATWCQH